MARQSFVTKVTMNIIHLIGKRALIKDSSWSPAKNNVHEVKFLETSSNEQWVKLQGDNGNKYWRPITDISVVDVLKEIRPAISQDLIDSMRKEVSK